MRIAQISDLHYTHITWNPFKLFSKRLLGNLNWLLTRNNSFVYEQLDPLPDLFEELGVDLVLLGGDFTTTSLLEEYEKASQFVGRLKKPWIAVPGNHDTYTYRSEKNKDFYRFFSNQSQKGPYRLSSHGIELHLITPRGVEKSGIAQGGDLNLSQAKPTPKQLNLNKLGDAGGSQIQCQADDEQNRFFNHERYKPNWWVIALDTTKATPLHSSRGTFSESQEKIFHEIMKTIPAGDSIICLNHYPFFDQPSIRRNLDRREALQKILEQYPQIALYLQGHTHRHAIADLQESNLPILLDSGSCVQKNIGTWNLIDLMPDHCEISAYHWNKKWTPFRKETINWKRKT